MKRFFQGMNETGMNTQRHLKLRLQTRRSHAAIGFAFACLATVAVIRSQVVDGLSDAKSRDRYERTIALPGARQSGVACAFYANVPALTFASGIHIADDSAESRAFIASIYGLRRGDFKFRRAFDKEVFFELFGMPAKGVKIYYDDLDRKALLKQAQKLVTGVFEDALDQGQFVSLRVYGELGMPHNVLLVAHRDGFYHYHDPTTGKIRKTGSLGLAARILTESKLKGSKIKKRYFSSYHLVSVGSSGGTTKAPLRLGQLPESLEIRLTEGQCELLARRLKPADERRESGAEAMVRSFSEIDFALIGKSVDGTPMLESAIDQDLPAHDLRGLANLTKLAINSYQIGARDLLPVWFVGNEPRVVTGYSAADGDREAGLMLLEGEQSRFMPLGEALEKAKASGPLFGYVRVPRG
jgi:hypothetical protein